MGVGDRTGRTVASGFGGTAASPARLADSPQRATDFNPKHARTPARVYTHASACSLRGVGVHGVYL